VVTVVLGTRLARFKVVKKIFQSRQGKTSNTLYLLQYKERKAKQAQSMRKQDKGLSATIHGQDTSPITSLHQFINMRIGQKEALLKYVPAVVFTCHDGGHDHKNTLFHNIAASVALIELLQLHACINNCNAPDGLWVNTKERCMNLLNLSLVHQSYARDECAIREYLAKSYTSMKVLRDLRMRDEVVKEEWSEYTSVMLDDIGTHMSQLFLEEEPVDVAHSATDNNVNALKEVLIGACDDFSDKLRSRDELHQMPGTSP
jgi:hypothetical protein